MSGNSTEPLVGSPPIPKSEMDARLATRDLPPAEWIERAIASGMDPIVMWNTDKDTRAICCNCLDVAEDHPLTPESGGRRHAVGHAGVTGTRLARDHGCGSSHTRRSWRLTITTPA